jgi:hypothetical protein
MWRRWLIMTELPRSRRERRIQEAVQALREGHDVADLLEIGRRINPGEQLEERLQSLEREAREHCGLSLQGATSRPTGLQQEEHLGDGVYVGHDGWQVVLWVEGSAYGPGAIALEPGVLQALDRYRQRVGLGGGG